jgi:hypothetical protein
MTSFLHVDLHIAAIGKRRTMIILAKLYRFYYYIIYVLHSFKCYLHENLDLIIIFFTLLQFFLFKTICFFFASTQNWIVSSGRKDHLNWSAIRAVHIFYFSFFLHNSLRFNLYTSKTKKWSFRPEETIQFWVEAKKDLTSSEEGVLGLSMHPHRRRL